MALVTYDKRIGPTGPNHKPFVTFTKAKDGRHVGYLSQAAMDAMGRPDRVLLSWDDGELLLTLENGDGDDRALSVTRPNPRSDAGQFSAGGFLRFFRLEEDLLGKSLRLHRVNGHLAVELMNLEDYER